MKAEKIYGYFNNHYHGYAPENCIEILEMLKLALPEQSEIKKRIIEYNKKRKPVVYEIKFEEPISEESSIERLLMKLTSRSRLERGKNIADAELSIEEITDEKILATIRDYMIDLDRKEIIHNCEDWGKGLGIKRICNHPCKLFLSIPEEQSKTILKSIIKEKDRWSFKYKIL